MPLYEYRCPECDLKFEQLRPLSRADEEAACPRCQHESPRVLSTFACFSTDESGLTTSIGGDSCSGCSSGTCSTCGM
jgi:putative FmdB family regulatory protein